MYTLHAECTFDSAHFLKGYPGKCAHIHGHTWRVLCEIQSTSLETQGETQGMIVDFKTLKTALKALVEPYDHKLIYEIGSLKESTLTAFESEGFALCPLPFRPTAENISKALCDHLTKDGWNVARLTVYETETNAASYSPQQGGALYV